MAEADIAKVNDDLRALPGPGLRRVAVNGEEILVAITTDGTMFPMEMSMAAALSAGLMELHDAFDAALHRDPVTDHVTVQAPVDLQEVWASGVTYERSREARIAESQTKDAYDLVYEAERPELFFKAAAWRVLPSGSALRIRADSGWDVPEPELGLVFTASGELAGFVVGDDLSSRAIESENPLYLPQAKVFDDSVGLSDTIILARNHPLGGTHTIELVVYREHEVVFRGETSTAKMHRTFDELAEYLFRELSFPHGVVLLTGTGIVPPEEFSLVPGDEVEITVSGVGRLCHGIYRADDSSNGRSTKPSLALAPTASADELVS